MTSDGIAGSQRAGSKTVSQRATYLHLEFDNGPSKFLMWSNRPESSGDVIRSTQTHLYRATQIMQLTQKDSLDTTDGDIA